MIIIIVEIRMQSIDYISKNNSLEDLESFCDDIFNLDSKIRFAGIINDKGKLLVENKKNGLHIFIDPKDLEILLMETALGVRMRRAHDSQLGPVKFTISCGRNVVSIIFPLETDILCVTAEKDLDFFKIPFLIIQLLETKIIGNDNVI